MKIKKKYIFLITLILVLSSATVLVFASPGINQHGAAPASASSEEPATSAGDPFYKLKENVRLLFRPEWIWDKNIRDYSNLGELKRDPETGLFPEPSPFPKDLEGEAHWDPYLGLYIANLIQIDHKTGKITETQPVMGTSGKEGWPDYKFTNDSFDQAFEKYFEYTQDKYYEGGLSSAAIPDILIMRRDGLTPDWFGLKLPDLPKVVEKLEAGADPAYTMALIMLLTDTDVGVWPSKGDSSHLDDWVNTFNSMKSLVYEKVRLRDFEGIGYLALPAIYDELKSGKGEDLIAGLPETTEGLKAADKSAMSAWGEESWVKWFDDNTETLNVLKWMIDHKIDMPWLK